MSDQIDRLKAVIMQLAIEGSQYRVRDFGATELMMQSADEIERLRAESATKTDRVQELEDRISDRDIEIERLRVALDEARLAAGRIAREHIADFQAACGWLNEYEWLQAVMEMLAARAAGGGDDILRDQST